MTDEITLEDSSARRYRLGEVLEAPADALSQGGRFVRLAERFPDGAFGADVLETPHSLCAVGWAELTVAELAGMSRVPAITDPAQGHA